MDLKHKGQIPYIPDWIFKQGLRSSEIALLCKLWRHRCKEAPYKSFPGRDNIMRSIRAAEGTMDKALHRLEERNLIVRHSRNRKSTVFELLIPPSTCGESGVEVDSVAQQQTKGGVEPSMSTGNYPQNAGCGSKEGSKGGKSCASPPYEWPEEIPKDRLEEICTTTNRSADVVKVAWARYRSRKIYYKDRFDQSAFDGFLHFLRTDKDVVAIELEIKKTETQLPVDEPENWRQAGYWRFQNERFLNPSHPQYIEKWSNLKSDMVKVILQAVAEYNEHKKKPSSSSEMEDLFGH